MSENIKSIKQKETDFSVTQSIINSLSSIDLDDAKKNFILQTGVSFISDCNKLYAELNKDIDELKKELDQSYNKEIDELEKRLDNLYGLINSQDINDELKNKIWDESIYISHRVDTLKDENRKWKKKEIESKKRTRLIIGGTVGGSTFLAVILIILKLK